MEMGHVLNLSDEEEGEKEEEEEVEKQKEEEVEEEISNSYFHPPMEGSPLL